MALSERFDEFQNLGSDEVVTGEVVIGEVASDVKKILLAEEVNNGVVAERVGNVRSRVKQLASQIEQLVFSFAKKFRVNGTEGGDVADVKFKLNGLATYTLRHEFDDRDKVVFYVLYEPYSGSKTAYDPYSFDVSGRVDAYRRAFVSEQIKVTRFHGCEYEGTGVRSFVIDLSDKSQCLDLYDNHVFNDVLRDLSSLCKKVDTMRSMGEFDGSVLSSLGVKIYES